MTSSSDPVTCACASAAPPKSVVCARSHTPSAEVESCDLGAGAFPDFSLFRPFPLVLVAFEGFRSGPTSGLGPPGLLESAGAAGGSVVVAGPEPDSSIPLASGCSGYCLVLFGSSSSLPESELPESELEDDSDSFSSSMVSAVCRWPLSVPSTQRLPPRHQTQTIDLPP